MTGEEQFKELYRRYIHREGAEELLEWMERETDFFHRASQHKASPGLPRRTGGAQRQRVP